MLQRQLSTSLCGFPISILLKVNPVNELTKARILQLHDSPFPFVFYENQVLTQTLPTFLLSGSKEIVSDKLFTIRLWETLAVKSPFWRVRFSSNAAFLTFPTLVWLQHWKHVSAVTYLSALLASLDCVFFLDNRHIYLAL